jgi:hypothetical protein
MDTEVECYSDHECTVQTSFAEFCEQKTAFQSSTQSRYRAIGGKHSRLTSNNVSISSHNGTPQPRLWSAIVTLLSASVTSLDEHEQEVSRPSTTTPTIRRKIETSIVGYTNTVEILLNSLQLHPFASERFHALLNSLFKVLCNFPSQYLFAIGLVVLFSLR